MGDFLKEGGFWFLPISWQDTSLEEKNPWFQLLVGILRCVEEKLPPVLKKFWDYEVEKEDEPEESKITSWHQFLLDTVKRSENQLYRLNCLIVSSYLLAVLLLDILLCVSKHSNGSVLLRSLRRLSTTYFLVFLSSMLYLHVIGQSNWAKDIRSGKAHRLPELHAIEDVNLPLTTLPLQEDILIAPQYASDFLASYSLVLEVSHPGNSHWKDLTQRNADGYVALPSQSMKKQFCQSIVNWVSVNSRFLIQDHSREWTVIDEMDVLLDFCNKELVMSSNRLTEALARQLESLKTETKYGRWHDKAIHKTTIPLYLDAWEKRLIPSLNKEKNPGQKPEDVFAARQLAVLKTRGSEISTFRTRQSLPPSPSPQEPFVGAWLREGDLVEAMYHCQHNGKWNPPGLKKSLLKKNRNSLSHFFLRIFNV